MIRINLLPVEKRKKERTPLPRFGLIVLDVGVLTAIVFYCVWVYLQILVVEDEVRQLNQTKADLQPYVDKHRDLQGRLAALRSQLTEIEQTTGRRIEWWRAMDSLWEVINSNPRVWLSEISLLEDRTTEGRVRQYNPEFSGTPPFGIQFRAHCAGREVTSFTKFRMDLKRSPELKRWFAEINWDAQWVLAEEPQFVEQYSMGFDVTLIGRQDLPIVTGGGPTGGPLVPAGAAADAPAPGGTR